MDKIDRIIDLLNAETGGEVSFDRDAIDVDRPEAWGALELRSQAETQWADGRPIDDTWLADLYLCVEDRESHWIALVNRALAAADEEMPLSWSMAERTYVAQLEKLLWRWQIRIWGPMEIPEENAGDPEGG